MSISDSMKAYSAKVGLDAMLIQGAGGNASWKDGKTMWIKASGKWLADAEKKEIFLPVDIDQALALVESGSKDLSLACLGDSVLRPSIETGLHAVMPQRLVMHFHSVDVIALAVRKDGKELLSGRLDGMDWVWVDYVIPGPKLAIAVRESFANKPVPSVIVLENHGLVIAADTLDQLQVLLEEVQLRCALPIRIAPMPNNDCLVELNNKWQDLGYALPQDISCHSLALDLISLELAKFSWVLYPDHAVFLGSHALINDASKELSFDLEKPPCVITPGQGVVVRKDLSLIQQAMLTCYTEITLRIPSIDIISPLLEPEIAELLNLDSEKYRKNINL